MAKILVASFLFICLLQEGIHKVQAANGQTPGDKCDKTSDCTNLICVEGKCQTEMKNPGESCSEANTACSPATLTCQEGKCKLKVGQDCTSATDKCLANAECTGTTSKKCTCKDGFKASQDNSKCGAMGVAASMLLVVATFLTSRFF